MKKKKATSKSTALVPVKRDQLTLADIGSIVLRDAEETVRQQIQATIIRQAEAVIGRIMYWKKHIEESQFWLSEFERKQEAIQKGQFTVNKWDGTVTFNDPTLQNLG